VALPGLNRYATRWLALLALGLPGGPAGCFSGDDFSTCTRDSECAGDRCVSGRCVAVATADAASTEGDATTGGDTGPGTDARPTGPDVALDDDCAGVNFDGPVARRVFYCPDRDVVIHDVTTGDPDGLHEKQFELYARRIEIVGRLDAHGAGFRGGGGGGGGGGGAVGLTPIGGRRGLVGNAETGDIGATAGTNGFPGGPVPGAGGPGGHGGGNYTPASGTGGPSGMASGDSAGPGADGQQIEPGTDRSSWSAVLCVRTARPGAGGGGGGGGAGAVSTGCDAGPGGGGGGAGTPGGGALLLHATEAIVINGKLDVSGGDRQTGSSRVQVPGGPCGADQNCVHPCDEASAPGVGGQGGSSANSGHAGADGLTTRDGVHVGGDGGDGGLGSGGHILLEAPEVIWAERAELNLTGGGQSTTNPGILVVVGHESGPNIPDRANAVGYLCDPVEYVPTDP
jgi:hypothetical protein